MRATSEKQITPDKKEKRPPDKSERRFPWPLSKCGPILARAATEGYAQHMPIVPKGCFQ